MKVLVVYPGKKERGGVSELYIILEPYMTGVRYFELFGYFRGRFNLIDSILMFFRFMVTSLNYDVIHLNPSFNKRAFVREAILILIGRMWNKKMVVFWHGWTSEFEVTMRKSSFYSWLFRQTYLKTNASIVLGSVFRNSLVNFGYKRPIFIEKNCAEDSFLKNSLRQFIRKEMHTPLKVLFLSRIEIYKGVFVAIEAIEFLNKKYPDSAKLIIAGKGTASKEVDDYILSKSIGNIECIGFVTGEEKHILLTESDILIFPSLSEGLPLTILECMMYGLPVISRPVGGIPDLVENGVNGFLTDSMHPDDYARILRTFIEDSALFLTISKNNRKLANQFTPLEMQKRLYSIYQSL